MVRYILGLLLYSFLIPDAAFGQAEPGFTDRLAVVTKRQHEAGARYQADLKGKTIEAEQRPVVDRYIAEVDRNTREVLDLVRTNPGDPGVVEALTFVIRTARAGPGDESYQAIELLRPHARDPAMGKVAWQIFFFSHFSPAEALMRAIVRENPNRFDRGLACHALATYLALQARMVRRIRAEPARLAEYVHDRHKAMTETFAREADLAAIDREVEATLERVIAEFADLQDPADPRPLGEIAEGELFALRNLAVGKTAPEIAGKDYEGKSFTLGELRGNVVLLTFSGNWCGPCVGMYPRERDLVRKLTGQPFAMVSVNTDGDVTTLKASIDSGHVTWRCWWDGGTSGPITTRWGISSFPSIFVLDRWGVIRFKDLRGDDLDHAVKLLLDEAETGS